MHPIFSAKHLSVEAFCLLASERNTKFKIVTVEVILRAVLCAVALPVSSLAAPSFHLARVVPLPGVEGNGGSAGIEGRFDHFTYDSETHRLFIAAVANGSLEVVDLEKGERVKSIKGLGGPQGVAIAPASGRVIVACGSEGAIHAFDTRTLVEKGKAQIGEDPDNVRFVNGLIYVGYGSETVGAVATIDPVTLKRISEVPLKAHPESFQLTPDGKRVYVNIPWAKRADVDGGVVAADLDAGKVTSTWTLAQTARNFPMVLDVEHHRVFVASRKPPKLMCLNTENGDVVSQTTCVEDSDDMYRDPKTNQIIVIGGGDREVSESNGAIELYAVDKRGKLAKVAAISTAPHARTGGFVPQRRAVYVAVPKHQSHEAELREYILSE